MHLSNIPFCQACLSIPIGDAISTESFDSQIDDAIEEIHTKLKSIPVIRISKSNNDLAEILNKFRENTPENETVRAVVSCAFIFVSVSIFHLPNWIHSLQVGIDRSDFTRACLCSKGD